MTLAKQIYDEHISTRASAQVNLPASIREPLDATFDNNPEPIAAPDVLDAAYNEIYRMTQNDSYRRFTTVAGSVRAELEAKSPVDWESIEGRERS